MAGVNDVVAALRAGSSGSGSEARQRLDEVLLAIAAVLIESGHVRLPIGVFRIVSRKGGPGRNPRTGEPVEIAPRRVVKFKASEGLKARIVEEVSGE